MELKTIRRNRLRLYIDQECSGNTAEFARRVKRSSQQVVDMLKDRKSFGEKVAAAFCDALRLPQGWFDAELPHGVSMPDDEIQLLKQYKKLSAENKSKVLNLANGLVDIQEVTRSIKEIQNNGSYQKEA